MKQVRVNRLTLTNFKGVKSFSVDMNGSDAFIYGDNATGKTTLFDAFLWLLFDKDSQNKKDFEIKTLQDGVAIPMLDHEVECELLVDNQIIKLGKVYREKYTKTRGSAKEEFSGHETNYFIDGTPLKKTEYSKRVQLLMEEEHFKLLTSPTYFNEQVKWQDRRKILLEVCGDVSEDDIFASNKELQGLKLILRGKTLDDFKATVNSRRKAINEELKRIPIRINEIQKSIPEDEGNLPELRTEVDNLDSEIEELQAQVSSIKNGNAVLAKKGELQKVEMEIQNLKRDLESGSKDEVYRLRAKLQEEQSHLQTFQSRRLSAENQQQYKQDQLERVEKTLVNLRNRWQERNKEEFTHEVACECPSCGQELPEEKVQSAKEKALAQFNARKSTDLGNIQEDGKRGATEKKKYEDEVARLQKEIEDLSGPIAEKEKVIEEIKTELLETENTVKDISKDSNYLELTDFRENLLGDIADLKERAEDAAGDIGDEIAEKKEKRSELNAEIARYANVGALKKRIEDLMDQEEQLAAEYEKLEHYLFLSEEFTRAKVSIIEDKIAAKFKYARFKLFETQINGGLQEVCETTFDGVPYGSGLNNAAKINIGLDIINTLSEFYGIQAPIFVDNAEAVTQLAQTDSQLISLIVSEKDKALRIETPNLEEAI
ncbi:DNA repair exonuclease SbcCD ATPase subunit [Planomicrobium stackebrandtii]|uniref:DNA repair exonuclease SbcCD ATPase subunit n=1 Tax=Planomicrobium stackebrandtii TaxID=253160 RepID=A0ABU0GQT0_9BACL|nr:AAA family ATPase [Planomicrobium stackebrandtii]MDQ0427713.1 DNA repair exonuclease SbcCD ATPase subunit [Planomicrobium stackebrandtii]